MVLSHFTARNSTSLGAYCRRAANAASTIQAHRLFATTATEVQDAYEDAEAAANSAKNNSIDAIKQAARRAGDAAQEWRTGGSSRASTAMRQAAVSSHSVYDSTKRAVEHGAAVGGQDAMSNRSVEDLESTEAEKKEALAAVGHIKDG